MDINKFKNMYFKLTRKYIAIKKARIKFATQFAKTPEIIPTLLNRMIFMTKLIIETAAVKMGIIFFLLRNTNLFTPI